MLIKMKTRKIAAPAVEGLKTIVVLRRGLGFILNVDPHRIAPEGVGNNPANTKHLYNIYTMLDQRRRRWDDIV